jgi:hypothetical protein
MVESNLSKSNLSTRYDSSSLIYVVPQPKRPVICECDSRGKNPNGSRYVPLVLLILKLIIGQINGMSDSRKIKEKSKKKIAEECPREKPFRQKDRQRRYKYRNKSIPTDTLKQLLVINNYVSNANKESGTGYLPKALFFNRLFIDFLCVYLFGKQNKFGLLYLRFDSNFLEKISVQFA